MNTAQKLKSCREAHPKTIRKDGLIAALIGCDGCELRLLQAELAETRRQLHTHSIIVMNLDWALDQICEARESDLPLRRFVQTARQAGYIADPADLDGLRNT